MSNNSIIRIINILNLLLLLLLFLIGLHVVLENFNITTYLSSEIEILYSTKWFFTLSFLFIVLGALFPYFKYTKKSYPQLSAFERRKKRREASNGNLASFFLLIGTLLMGAGDGLFLLGISFWLIGILFCLYGAYQYYRRNIRSSGIPLTT